MLPRVPRVARNSRRPLRLSFVARNSLNRVRHPGAETVPPSHRIVQYHTVLITFLLVCTTCIKYKKRNTFFLSLHVHSHPKAKVLVRFHLRTLRLLSSILIIFVLVFIVLHDIQLNGVLLIRAGVRI